MKKHERHLGRRAAIKQGFWCLGVGAGLCAGPARATAQEGRSSVQMLGAILAEAIQEKLGR